MHLCNSFACILIHFMSVNVRLFQMLAQLIFIKILSR
jgi:hypothetical protein